MTDLPREFVDQIARAIGDPGSVVGRKFGPSWGEGNDGYAENEETVTRWSTRAVLEVLVASGYRREADVRAEVAKEIERMPYGLDDEGWEYLVRKAEEAGYVRRVVMRRRNTFSGDTAEVAYQYGYRRAAKVARATAPEPVGALPVAGSFGAVVHEQSDLKGTSKAGQERSEEQQLPPEMVCPSPSCHEECDGTCMARVRRDQGFV